MWLKLFFLLLYLLLLFVLARLLDTLAWYAPSWPGLPTCTSYSCRFLDPVLMSVVQLKAVLDQRGLSYERVLEKSELTDLVSVSGQVSLEEVEQSQLEDTADVETNFTSGTHFIEQVEDAKDSVWLVQVSGHQHSRGSHLIGDSRWKNLKRKMIKYGVRLGRLDCSLDIRYCRYKGWHSPFMLLALPSQHQKKANVAMYNFSSNSPVRETALLHWVRDRLDQKVERVADVHDLSMKWQDFGGKNSLEPEVKTVLFTNAESTPMFYSALSVKFPGRVKFGVASLGQNSSDLIEWHDFLNMSTISKLPAYVVYTAEGNYTYGFRSSEHFNFDSMERFFKTLYPSLNDVFIFCFCIANAIAFLEPFVSNCSVVKRIKKFSWCVFKYNMIVILLWLPLIGIFQMPFLDNFPLLALKCVRMFSLSGLGQIIRGDYYFYFSHRSYILVSFAVYILVVSFLCKKYLSEEVDAPSDWFNFRQMQTLTHLRPNNLFESRQSGRTDLLSSFDFFASRFSQSSLWLSPSIPSEYIQRLPTWTYRPVSMAALAQANVKNVQAMLKSASDTCTCRCAQLQGSENPSPHHSQDHTCYSYACSSISRTASAHLIHSHDQRQRNDHQEGSSTSCVGIHAGNPSEISTNSCDEPRSDDVPYPTSMSSNIKNIPCQPITKDQCSNCGVTYQPIASASNPENGDNNDQLQSSIVNPIISEGVDTLSYNNQVSLSARGSGFPAGYLESHQCVICLEEYVPLTSLCGLPCGHVFHETCIISWLNTDKHFCPMCRWPSYQPRPYNHPL